MLFAFTLTNAIYTSALDCGQSRSFNMDRGAWQDLILKSHPEDRKYLCRFHPCNEILMRLYEIFETGKKQDLTPLNATYEKIKSWKN